MRVDDAMRDAREGHQPRRRVLGTGFLPNGKRTYVDEDGWSVYHPTGPPKPAAETIDELEQEIARLRALLEEANRMADTYAHALLEKIHESS